VAILGRNREYETPGITSLPGDAGDVRSGSHFTLCD
jgi:hypothetical protein